MYSWPTFPHSQKYFGHNVMNTRWLNIPQHCELRRYYVLAAQEGTVCQLTHTHSLSSNGWLTLTAADMGEIVMYFSVSIQFSIHTVKSPKWSERQNTKFGELKSRKQKTENRMQSAQCAFGSLCTVHCSLFTVHSLFIHCSLFTVHCSLFTVHCEWIRGRSTVCTVCTLHWQFHCAVLIHYSFSTFLPSLKASINLVNTTVDGFHRTPTLLPSFLPSFPPSLQLSKLTHSLKRWKDVIPFRLWHYAYSTPITHC